MVSLLGSSRKNRELDSGQEYQVTEEQEENWFLGSLMNMRGVCYKDYKRLAILHNRITHEETKFDDRFQSNRRIAAKLVEFFPLKWLTEITSVFQRIEAKQLGIKTYKDRVASYLSYIELYLTFRRLTLYDSTLAEINKSLEVNITKNEVRSWKLKLLRIIPGLKEEWIKIRYQSHQAIIVSTVVQIMNLELNLDKCSKEIIFHIKQEVIRLARIFAKTSRAKHIKKPEMWARAICLKALREIVPNYAFNPFPDLPVNLQKVIENKRWQLDQIL
ncbi:MAG: hypothetical protein ACFE9L_02180 [Candidatus Hodarchaeota archaeon]